jgi:hypothetical protein
LPRNGRNTQCYNIALLKKERTHFHYKAHFSLSYEHVPWSVQNAHFPFADGKTTSSLPLLLPKAKNAQQFYYHYYLPPSSFFITFFFKFIF